MTNSWK